MCFPCPKFSVAFLTYVYLALLWFSSSGQNGVCLSGVGELVLFSSSVQKGLCMWVAGDLS